MESMDPTARQAAPDLFVKKSEPLEVARMTPRSLKMVSGIRGNHTRVQSTAAADSISGILMRRVSEFQVGWAKLRL
jgi:hypothetical protein